MVGGAGQPAEVAASWGRAAAEEEEERELAEGVAREGGGAGLDEEGGGTAEVIAMLLAQLRVRPSPLDSTFSFCVARALACFLSLSLHLFQRQDS